MRRLRYLLLIALAMPASALSVEYDIIAYHDVRDDVVGEYDSDPYAVSTDHLLAHFRWLRPSTQFLTRRPDERRCLKRRCC